MFRCEPEKRKATNRAAAGVLLEEDSGNPADYPLEEAVAALPICVRLRFSAQLARRLCLCPTQK